MEAVPVNSSRIPRWRSWASALAVALILGGTLVLGWPTSVESRSGPTEVTSLSRIVVPPRPDRDVSWYPVAGIALPVSQTAGPQCLSKTRAACFARTQDGVAIAAVQILVHTFAGAGPTTFKSTISQQIVGSDADALMRCTEATYLHAVSRIGECPSSSGGCGRAVGYRLDHQPGPASVTAVRVLLAQESGFTEYALRLVWRRGDWRLLAPANGDWRSSAHVRTARETLGYRTYDHLGIGAGGAI
jgi:hypothetical protein